MIYNLRQLMCKNKIQIRKELFISLCIVTILTYNVTCMKLQMKIDDKQTQYHVRECV